SEAWQQTLSALQRIESLQEEQAALQETLDNAPDELRRLRQQIKPLQTVNEERLRQRFSPSSLQTLDATLGDLVARMYDWQNELTRVNSDLIAAETRPEKTQSRISANQSRVTELNEQRPPLPRQPQTQLN